MAEHQRRLQAANEPSSSRKVPWLQPASVALKPAPLPKPKPVQRPVKANPPANTRTQRTYVRNPKGYSPPKPLVAEKSLDSTQGRRSEGPHAQHLAATVRVAVAASSIAAPATTTTPPTVADPSSTPTSTTSAATTGTSAGSSASTGFSAGSSASTGFSSGSSASTVPSSGSSANSGAQTPSAESLPPARQPEEGDEAMTADQ